MGEEVTVDGRPYPVGVGGSDGVCEEGWTPESSGPVSGSDPDTNRCHPKL